MFKFLGVSRISVVTGSRVVLLAVQSRYALYKQVLGSVQKRKTICADGSLAGVQQSDYSKR